LQPETNAERYADTVILRPGCEYGPHGELWSGRIARWLFAHRIGDLGAAGDGFCNLVHIDDLAAAVVLALQDPLAVGRAYNLSMPNPPTWNDYLVRYARALGAVPVKRISGRQLALETKVLAAPLKALEIAAHAVGVGEVAPPPIPPSLLRLTRQEICLVATRAQLELGWTCRPLAQGLAQTAAWFNQARSGVEPSVVT
jgi:nucleoside-diphosphate-sugar epimerase